MPLFEHFHHARASKMADFPESPILEANRHARGPKKGDIKKASRTLFLSDQYDPQKKSKLLRREVILSQHNWTLYTHF